MKTMKRFLTALLFLTLILATAAPSFAVTPNSMPANGYDSFYIQGNASSYAVSGQFTVYLSINSGTYQATSSVDIGPIDTVLAVIMGTESSPYTTYTVMDVLTAAQTQHPNLYFDMTTSDPTGYHPIWVHGVKDTTIDSSFWFEDRVLYYTTNTYYVGWMFRINGNLPYNTASQCCLMSEAYVSPGDVINLYYCNIYNRNFATKPRAAVLSSYYYDNALGGYSASLQALQTECYMGTTDWVLEPWASLANKSLDVYVDGVLCVITTDSMGFFTLTGLSGGTHSVQFVTTTKSFKVNSNLNFPKYKVPKDLGLYCTFAI